jgi:hypothetical protein
MALAPSIDPAPYVRPPRLGIASGLSLSKMLLLRVPTKPGPGVIMAAKLLAATIVATEADWRSQGKTKPARKARAADVRLDRAWTVIHRRLADHEGLASEDSDRIRSVELIDRLFPTGLRFTQLRFMQEHAHSERLLAIIEDEALRPDLDHLVGKRFMDELVLAHADYGVVLGITEAPADEPTAVSMMERLRELTQAIGDHALQVLAYSRMHPDHLAPAQRALAPIDMFREAARRASSRRPADADADADASPDDDYALPEDAPAPDAPVPVVPEE